MTTATHDAGLGVELALDRASAAVVAYRAHVRKVIEVEVAPLVDAAERDRRFPPEAVAALGAAGSAAAPTR